MKKTTTLGLWLFFIAIPVLGTKPPFPVNSKVIEAIKKNDVKRVKGMLDKGVDFNVYVDSEGAALTIAISLGYEEIVDLMLQHKVSVAPEWDRTGPVDTAIKTGNLKILKKLAEAKADLNDIGYDQTPLMIAIQYHRMDCIRFLVDQGADIEKTDPYGSTALNGACWYNNIEAIDYLVDRGADYKHRVGNGFYENTVDFAASIGNLKLLTKLIEKGADIFQISPKSRETLLHYAAWKCMGKVDPIPIQEKVQMVRYLVSQGLPVDARDIIGDTPLINAVQADYIEIVKTLLELGVDKTIKDKDGKTALDYAETEVKNPEMIRILCPKIEKRYLENQNRTGKSKS